MTTVTIRQPVAATDLPRVEPPTDVRLDRPAAPTEQVFPQSVASGGPKPTGVILWTRVNPEQYEPSEQLYLEVAPDPSFETEVTGLEFSGPGVKPPDNYTIRVDLEGLLDPDSVYYYRFTYRGVRSPTGRCRTLPAEDASPESLRFGVVNCQDYQNGYFGALAHLAETDVDFVIHLGDYIYEQVADGYPNGEDGPYSDRRIDLPDGETRPMSLEDFRHIYETYKTDPHLQRLHERHTVIQTWDDHAIANDRYWDYDANAPVFPDHPCGDVPEFTRYLTRAGIQAWWESIPARIKYYQDAERIHKSFELYRSHQFGDLVTLLLTDERLFRSRPLSRPEKLFGEWNCSDRSRTMLGKCQREWLRSELRESETVWTAWANAVLFKPLYFVSKLLLLWKDAWSGFEEERRDIVETLAEIRQHGETSVVTLTGDMHMTLATRLLNEPKGSTPVGVEFMTPSVTSVNPREKGEELAGRVLERVPPSVRGLSVPGSQDIGECLRHWAGRLVARVIRDLSNSRLGRGLSSAGLMPRFVLTDGATWGYSVVEFSRDVCTWDVYCVDKTVNSAEAECTPAYRIRLEAGTYSIEQRHEDVPEPGGNTPSDRSSITR